MKNYSYRNRKPSVKLRKFREENGLTQQEIASKLACNRAYISQLEKGKFPFTMNILTGISKEYPNLYKLLNLNDFEAI